MNPSHVPHSLVGSVVMSMAGNELINSYLKAILDSGTAAIAEDRKPKKEMGHFNPTKYFVKEVVTGVDETELYGTWIKVMATHDSHEQSTRLENTCWRIWYLTRKKKQLEWENLQRRLDARRFAVGDMAMRNKEELKDVSSRREQLGLPIRELLAALCC